MEFKFLHILAFLSVAIVANGGHSEEYWNSVLPNTPMPAALKHLLHPTSEWLENESTNVGVGKGGVNVNTGKPGSGTTVGVGKGGVGVNTGKPGSGTTVGVGKGGVGVNTGKPGSGTTVGVGKGGVNVHTRPRKGKPVHVSVGKSPFDYNYAATETQLHDNRNVALFFLEKDLHAGKRMNLQFSKTTDEMSNNSLSSSIPPQLGNLLELVELDLGFNSLSGSLPLELGGLRSLRKMLIGNNELKGPLLDGLFKSLTQLEDLVLCRNSFDDELPDSLWSMSNLKHLDLSVNNLSGVFPHYHAAHFNVTGGVFNFSNNLLYGNLISRFGEVGVVDVSWNYFLGSSPRNDSGFSILLSNNCLTSVLYQRSNDACVKFYAERRINFGNESSSKPLGPPLEQPTTSRKRLTYVMIGVFGGLGLIVVLIGVALLLRSCKTNHQRDPNVHNLEEGESEMPPPKVLIDLCSLGEAFTYEEMILITSNFSTENLLKQGHSGDLFRGRLESGTHVVVKKVDLRFIRRELFMSELELFSKAMHPRLVPLVGHCLDGESDKFFVYKYAPNGDLSNALYRSTNSQEGLQSLDWITRLKIAIGAAEALSYLHHECSPPFVHRDIQASSILLDDKYEVRIGSLSEVCAQGAINHQYMVSRLLRTPQTSGKRPSGSSSSTCAYDVYCFGKVLLELVTGKLGISTPNDADAKQWLESNLPLISIYEKEMVIKIVDQSLIIDEDLLEEVWAVAVVAKSCLNPKASRRPSMRHVLKALENPFKVVREENFSSGRLRTASWTAAFFGSWNNSSSDSSNMSSQTNREIIGGLKQSDRVGSRGSGTIDHSSSHKRSSSDVFPEPVEIQDGVNTSYG